ncbi:D-alanyl-D-alanine carboxypeptidase [Adhaeribacter swui]|uniref:D-alanyl-D-alanine carboxypeptidase n=1 Tax=Adhaeribacter swui TaxID=2086471 RepID=A0A7G7G387_9BACT|nr:D-alanyl-D-alanine carboxypeptidase [Adhaeribacter swui]QNF31621.1 D-alanyl-D-alanine carboxypeptidase [Adhaeribacter swui]
MLHRIFDLHQPQIFFLRLVFKNLFFFLLLASACQTAKPVATSAPAPTPTTPAISPKPSWNQVKEQLEQSPVFAQHFTGFALYDLDSSKMVVEHNAHKYFTPASNTKILTLYAGLKILKDSIPALRYQVRRDSLIFWGTGDPTLLHPDLKNNRVFNFLKNRREKLFFSAANFAVDALGPGWSWQDYNDYYSAERSSLPVYGNVVRFTGKFGSSQVQVQPRYFRNVLKTSILTTSKNYIVLREPDKNQFTFYPRRVTKDFAVDVPLKLSTELTRQLLGDTLRKPVKILNRRLPMNAHTLYATPADTLYKRMMQDSDNMFAEHLLLLCSATVFDSLNTSLIINHVKKTFLLDLPDQPNWVDGSGLSRFNLITPRSIVALWLKIYQEVPRDRLFSLLTIGGKTGTLKRFYQSEAPFVFGKTGSLSNNYSQSGFITGKSGRTYIFAFMNNNYTRSSAEIQLEMERIVTQIHQNF